MGDRQGEHSTEPCKMAANFSRTCSFPTPQLPLLPFPCPLAMNATSSSSSSSSSMEHQLMSVGTVSLGAYILVAHAAALAAQHSSPFRRRQTDRVIREGMSCRHIPSLSMAVVKDGKVLMTGGYGVKDLMTKEPVTSHTRFLVASLTKAFTATLLADVMKEQKKKISTNVYKLMDGFKFNNTLRSVYATVEDLLSHRMGIPRNNFVRLSEHYSIDSFARKIRYLPSKGGFRDSFYYSDLMYGLAAHITQELKGGTPWKQQIRDMLFGPLGMTSSTFVEDVDFDRDDVATPYSHRDNRTVKVSVDFIKHWARNTGSGNVMSTASDMARWMLMLLRQGKDGEGRRVVREGVVQDLFSPRNVLNPSYGHKYRKPSTPFSFTSDSYGLAWKLGYYRGYRMVHHSGSSFGYCAYLSLLPEVNVGVVTLMTGEDDQYQFRTALQALLLDRALGQEPWINSSTICTFPQPWLSAGRTERSADTPGHKGMPAADNEGEEDERESPVEKRERVPSCVTHNLTTSEGVKYAGTYYHDAYGGLSVTYNASSRALVLEYGIGLWCLQSAGKRHYFKGMWLKDPPTLDMEFRFQSKAGSVVAMVATSFERKVPPVFRRQ